MKKTGLVLLFLASAAVVGGSRLMRLKDTSAIHPQHATDLYLRNKVHLPRLSYILVDSLHIASNKKELRWAANLLGWHSFQPGHYAINHNFTYESLLSKLAKGNQDPVSVTIVPGKREPSIALTLARKMRFDSAAVLQALKDSSFLAKEHLTRKTALGHLFPETYKFYWTSPPKIVLKHIFNEFNQKVIQPYHARFDSLKLSQKGIITLASIIEGEAAHNDEKPVISGLYWNRLKKNMYLQADPTVLYALKKRRRLHFKDYNVDSPYNTYKHKGLPPGPINNPSLSSIKAALFPANNDYLYMVARPNGYHSFSKTYAKHRQQSKKWRNYLRSQRNAAADSTTGQTTNQR